MGPRFAALDRAAPFMNQIAVSPVAVLRQRMSDLVSPSKSPVSATVHAVGTLPRLPNDASTEPFISQITALPLVSRQRMSALPSPLKSPVATIDQPRDTL